MPEASKGKTVPYLSTLRLLAFFLKVLSGPRAHHLNELLHEEIGLVNLWIKLSQLAHGLLFFRFEVLRTTQKHNGNV